MVFPIVRYGCERLITKKAEHWRTDAFELVLEKTPESPLDIREIKPVNPKENPNLTIHWKDWCWSWSSNTLATWCEEPIHWKRPWCWERLRAGGEGADRGWDDWMASPTQWTWVWTSSRWWWKTGKPGVLQSMGSQRVGHDLVTDQQQNWTSGYPLNLDASRLVYSIPKYNQLCSLTLVSKTWIF